MEAGLERSRSVGIGRRVLWLLLVVLLPLVVSAVMVAVALQMVGVPVWKDVHGWVNPAHVSPQTTELSQAKQQDAADRTHIASLEHQIRQLQNSVAQAQSRSSSLNIEVTKLKEALHVRSTLHQQAMQEASVLVAMDTGQAAQVLAKMPIAEAAQIAALMSPDNSGAILGQMDPTVSSKILLMAGKDAAQKTGTP